MTGIPDAVVEAAAEAHYEAEFNRPWAYVLDAARETYRVRMRAALAAAEGPWREHLATELEAVAEGIETNDQEYESGQRWAFFDAARIVRGTNE